MIDRGFSLSESENLDRFWARTDATFHGASTYFTGTSFEIRDDWGSYGEQVSRKNAVKCKEFALRLCIAELALWSFLAIILLHLFICILK